MNDQNTNPRLNSLLLTAGFDNRNHPGMNIDVRLPLRLNGYTTNAGDLAKHSTLLPKS
jgi:hypothetical protein